MRFQTIAHGSEAAEIKSELPALSGSSLGSAFSDPPWITRWRNTRLISVVRQMAEEASYEAIMARVDSESSRPLIIGSLMHKVMETYPTLNLSILEGDPELLNLKKSVEKFQLTELGSGIVVLAEHPVMAQVDAPGMTEELLTGTIDAIMHCLGKCYLVDWKTSKSPSSMNMAQVIFYTAALEGKCPACGKAGLEPRVVYLSKTHKRGKCRIFGPSSFTPELVEWLIRLNFGLPVEYFMEELS